MGLLSSAFAIKKIQNIKRGRIEQLSVADIAMVITNLQDAQKNLPKDKFDKIYSLFSEFCKCTLKTSMGINEYLNTAIKIISKYDEIAPYEKYSGGDKMEFSVIMDDIRKNRANDNIVQILHNICMDYRNEYAITEYIKKIQSGFPMSIPHNTMLAFVGVLLSNDLYGKSVAMNYFDKLANYVIGHNEAYCGSYLAYLCGVLCANNVIGKNESKELAEKYIRQILLQKANIDDALSKSEKNERYDEEEEYDEDAECNEDEDCDEDEEYDESEDCDGKGSRWKGMTYEELQGYLSKMRKIWDRAHPEPTFKSNQIWEDIRDQLCLQWEKANPEAAEERCPKSKSLVFPVKRTPWSMAVREVSKLNYDGMPHMGRQRKGLDDIQFGLVKAFKETFPEPERNWKMLEKVLTNLAWRWVRANPDQCTRTPDLEVVNKVGFWMNEAMYVPHGDEIVYGSDYIEE